MAFSLTSLNVSKIPENGGSEIEINGIFEIGVTYYAFIGDTQSTLDFPCHGGGIDKGNGLLPYSTTVLKCYTPRLPANATLSVTVQDSVTLIHSTLVDIVTTTYRQYQSMVFDVRTLMAPIYYTGPKSISEFPTG